MADIDRTAGVESVDVARAELAAARTESGVKTWARKALLGVTTALAKLKSNPHLVPTVDALIKDVERLKAENADRLVTIAKLEEAGRLLGINV